MPSTILPCGIHHGVKYHTSIVDTDAQTVVRLHRTNIATLCKATGRCILNSGGWNTPTTIRRMNEYLHHWGFEQRVSKKDFESTDILDLYKDGVQQWNL